jgi:hypothetical protein
MKYLLGLPILLVGTAALAGPTVQNNVCVPTASGVPTREGPPKWVDWTGTGTIPADTALDDPRWLGATGQTFALGNAMAPLQSRALVSTLGATGKVKKYLYLSFIVDLEGFNTGTETTARDVFIGFHRPPSAGAVELGYLFQFHLTGTSTGTGTGVTVPPYCGDYSTCDESSAGHKDFWRILVDKGNVGLSACSGNNGEIYEPLGGVSAPINWVTNTTPAGQDAVKYWKVASADPSPFLQNRWAVQVRFPMVAAVGGSMSAIGDGIEIGSTYFYEATAKLAGPGLGIFAKVGWYPLSITSSVCPMNSPDQVVHDELGNAGATCPACDPLKFALLSDFDSPPPSPPAPACDGGLDIDAEHIGVLFNTAIPTNIETIGPGVGMTHLSNQFTAHDTTTTNHVIALPFNTRPIPAGGGTANDSKSHIQARFRLAEWGSAPWSVPGDIGKWKDIRGAGSGICGTPPLPPPAPPQICGETDIAAQKHGLVTFNWTIGGDTGAGGIGASEYCEFGLTPPAASGETCSPTACSCTDPADCAPGTGVQATKAGGGFWPCVPSIYQFDQCMLVELNSPNGDATFVHQSIWNNMRFGEMSTLAHEALIDARHLPTAPGQKFQDIYFIAMPRNMPQSVPPTSTSVELAQNAALNAALVIAQPYLDDLKRIPPDDVARIAKRFQRPALDARASQNDERVGRILRARQIMVDADARRVDGLLEIALSQTGKEGKPSATLVHNAVGTLGSSAAAQVVPTLEIYPFYQRLGKGKAYDPMTAFTLYLSHESTLSGIRYQIDGAEQVGANIYHMQIPVGFARKIQVRAQALTANDKVLLPGNPAWPCSSCCPTGRCGLVAGLGNTLPAGIAGMFVIGRRRRRRRGKPQS